MSAATERIVTKPKPKPNYETTAWKWMRYSGFLLIPLVWGHVLLQDIIVGVHKIDLDYVALRWASIGWRAYDTALLAFAFAHGVNGIRQVLNDFVHSPQKRRLVNTGLFVFWAVITGIGAITLIGGVRSVP
jgi:succinate dehydrogenase / fumarate reductase membrane anchor subunit